LRGIHEEESKEEKRKGKEEEGGKKKRKGTERKGIDQMRAMDLFFCRGP
jgi:hypothetical protein